MARILLLTEIFPPEIGGPATYMDALAVRLAAAGHRVTVICRTAAGGLESDEERPFRVIRLAGQSNMVRWLRWMLPVHFLTHDRILVNGYETYAAAAARWTRRPYLLKIVGDVLWERARYAEKTRLGIDAFQEVARELEHGAYAAREESLRRAERILVPSEYLKKLVMGWGVAADKISVVANGVELGAYEGFEPRERRRGEPLRLIFAGRLVNWKGVETLLRALPLAADVELAIAGDGPERAGLEKLSRCLGLDHSVRFLGPLSGGALRAEMRSAHVFVLMSEYEGLSHVLLEAAAAGLCPVASRAGGNPEIIHDQENGCLVDGGDADGLAKVLGELRDDDARRRRLADRARATARTYAFGRTLEATMELLR